MHPPLRRLARTGAILFVMASVQWARGQQATIIDSGSTNRPGMRVTLDHEGHATIESRNEPVRHLKLREHLCNQFMRDLKAAEPLDALPTRHCMKSASFGSSMYIEFNGVRSRDLSCSPQADERAAALQRDANEILEAAHKR